MFGFKIIREKKQPNFRVTVFVDGKHPYRTEPEFQYKSHTLELDVYAKDWTQAGKTAVNKAIKVYRYGWSYRATVIERIRNIP
jgi:hypothetical protein